KHQARCLSSFCRESTCILSLFYAQLIGGDGDVGGSNSFIYLLLCVGIDTNRGSLFDFQWIYNN
ncbi:TPA: hypothetical protein ACHVDQ_002041, partial [Streptococcus suis]